MTNEHKHGAATIAVSAIVLAAVIMLGSWAWTSVANRVDAVQEKQSIGLQRISKNEAEITALKEGLARIEKKLDETLERLRK